MVAAKKKGGKVAKSASAPAVPEAEEVEVAESQQPDGVEGKQAQVQALDALGRPAYKIPDGKPKSGRVWKVKQTSRFSTIMRSGMMSHLSTSYEEKKALRDRRDNMKQVEREMKEEKKAKADEAKQRREEQLKRKAANEYKNSVYQVIKPETMKGMSKKQLRMVRKTAINKQGQTELVNVFTGKKH